MYQYVMRLLVIKHNPIEGAGIFVKFCRDQGVTLDEIDLQAGDRFPPLEDYAGLLVMGGAMNVGDEAEYPWLVEEKKYIRTAVNELHKPYLGVCLGAQLLADALGGEVGPMPQREIGVYAVELNQMGLNSLPTKGMPSQFKTLQWHGQEVRRLPEKAKLLASSPLCQVQAFSINDHAFGIQFHQEIDQETIDLWREDLAETLGTAECDRVYQELAQELPHINQTAKVLFDNFLQVVVTQ
jgi:GMP synthase-like glutamine amidotransferase